MKLGNGHVSEVWARAPFKAAAFAAMCMLACTAYGDGATFKLKTGIITDWTNEASYVEGSVPSANDIVEIQDRSTGIVYSTDIESCRLVSSLARIKPLGDNLRSCVIFDIAENAALTNGCAICGVNNIRGSIIKRGEGELVLNSSGRTDYNVNRIRVEKGILRGSLGVVRGEVQFSHIYVAAGAEFHLPLFDWNSPSVSSIFFNSLSLSGDGDFYYDESGNHSAVQYRITDICEFGGTLHGNQMSPFFQGRVMLTGVASDFPNNLIAAGNYGNLSAPGAKGLIGLMKIGKKGEVSSMGKANFQTDSRGGGFLYLGNSDDTTDRDFVGTATNPDGPTFFDAGHHGGITFTGQWRLNGGSTATKSGHFVIMGSNTVPCVLANDILSWVKDGNPYAIHMQKKGTGTWRFADFSSRSWAGALTVDEGTIQFDSMAETNKICALGKATCLTEPYRTTYDASKNVAWAHRLGSTNSVGDLVEGGLEYLGTSPGISGTRSTVLAGIGRIDAAGSGSLYMANVSGYGTGNRTLILDGAACTTNLLVGIADSNACVSVVKEGAGMWTIGGELDFSGDLEVKGGTLAICDYRARPYSWFRFSITQLYSTASTQHIVMQDLALYDAEGRRQNVGLAYDFPDPYPTNKTVYCNEDYTATLAPGGVAYGDAGWYKCFDYNSTTPFTQGKEADIRRLFDDISSGMQTPYNGRHCTSSSGSSLIVPSVGNPSTWFRIVMRMTNGTPAIVAYDISRGSGSEAERDGHPVYFGMEGSIDGLVWDELHAATPEDDHSADNGSAAYKWMSDGTAFANKNTLRPNLGYRFPRTHRVLSSSPLAKVRKISVSGGATLVTKDSFAISNLVLDATSPCTIDGFSFPDDPSATLTIKNLPVTQSCVTLPCTFVNVTGLDNINNWTHAFDVAMPRRRVRVVDGRVVVAPRGISVSFR
jgi:autotransporter-associated beta strand protein